MTPSRDHDETVAMELWTSHLHGSVLIHQGAQGMDTQRAADNWYNIYNVLLGTDVDMLSDIIATLLRVKAATPESVLFNALGLCHPNKRFALPQTQDGSWLELTLEERDCRLHAMSYLLYMYGVPDALVREYVEECEHQEGYGYWYAKFYDEHLHTVALWRVKADYEAVREVIAAEQAAIDDDPTACYGTPSTTQ